MPIVLMYALRNTHSCPAAVVLAATGTAPGCGLGGDNVTSLGGSDEEEGSFGEVAQWRRDLFLPRRRGTIRSGFALLGFGPVFPWTILNVRIRPVCDEDKNTNGENKSFAIVRAGN